jgi:DNA-binding MarR family transcriptional regulator
VTDEDLADLGSDLTLYAARLIRRLRREQEQPVGMRVLSVLDELGPTGVTRLAAVDQCSQPTKSGIVNGLVERGWVRKDADPDDARASLVTLTDAGRAVIAAARHANGAVVAGLVREAGRDPAELATAVALLRALLEDPEGL